MPEEKKSSTPLKFELFEIQKAVEEIRDHTESMKPKPALTRFFGIFLHGMVQGLGFVIGTTILAGIGFLLLKNFLTSTGFEDWLGNQARSIVDHAIEQAVSGR
ncbi:MAG: hypothetical protein WCT24_03845 [Patescibacteria group bacterium]|jgi:hypothetical protein